MASARKTYVRTKPAHAAQPQGQQVDSACFINDVLDGTITATRMEIIVAPGNGLYLRTEYIDPNGNGGGPP
jgi:hypothetical protein